MKHLKTLVIAISLLTTASAEAQFTNCYSSANWTQSTLRTNGVILINTNSISMLADTDGMGNGAGTSLDCSATGAGNVFVCITITGTGQLMFNWTWSGGNQATFTNEPFGYCLNGIPTILSTPGIGNSRDTVNVTSGDRFCFVVSSDFANSHFTVPTSINISNFSGPCMPVGLEDLSKSFVSKPVISPNPTSGNVFISTNPIHTNEAVQITVTDLSGKTILSKKLKDNNSILQLDLSDLTKGFYFIMINDGKNSFVQKVVKLDQ